MTAAHFLLYPWTLRKNFPSPTRTALRSAVFLLCAAACSPLIQAATVTYNFSYAGANTFTPSATATGGGFFTVSYTDLGPQPPSALTDFSFVMTLTTNGPSSESSTFTYGLTDIAANPSVILGGTALNPLPFQLDVVTNGIAGTDNVFGTVAADLNMLPSGGSILTQGFSYLGDTAGPAVWTSIVISPEPSTVGLLMVPGFLALILRFKSLRLTSPQPDCLSDTPPRA